MTFVLTLVEKSTALNAITPTMTPLSINIIGSGSMGNLWTAYLLKNQCKANLFARNTRALQRYQLITPTESFFYNTDCKSLNQWKTPDFIIICVKATALKKLCLQLKSITISHPPILLMMNGMGIVELAEKYFPTTEIFQASTNHGARFENDQLFHTGYGETLIGKLECQYTDNNAAHSTNKNTIEALIHQLHQALPTTQWNSGHDQTLWKKLLINSIINPLTAINGAANGDIVDNTSINKKAIILCEELTPILKLKLPTLTWKSLLNEVESVAKQTYTNISSMRQDITMGRKTEIDFISGYLLEVAKNNGIELPEHEQLLVQIKHLERKF